MRYLWNGVRKITDCSRSQFMKQVHSWIVFPPATQFHVQGRVYFGKWVALNKSCSYPSLFKWKTIVSLDNKAIVAISLKKYGPATVLFTWNQCINKFAQLFLHTSTRNWIVAKFSLSFLCLLSFRITQWTRTP